MSARPYYVRFTDSGPDEWCAETRDITKLSKVFDKDEKTQSVYEVAGPDDEFAVFAAFLLTNKFQDKAWTMLRIRQEDVDQAGVAIDPSCLGTTGVPWADCRHRDLVADAAALVELTRIIAEERVVEAGQDRLRRVNRFMTRRALLRPPAPLPPDCVWPSYASRLGTCLLAKKGFREVGRDLVREEIQSLPLPQVMVDAHHDPTVLNHHEARFRAIVGARYFYTSHCMENLICFRPT